MSRAEYVTCYVWQIRMAQNLQSFCTISRENKFLTWKSQKSKVNESCVVERKTPVGREEFMNDHCAHGSRPFEFGFKELRCICWHWCFVCDNSGKVFPLTRLILRVSEGAGGLFGQDFWTGRTLSRTVVEDLARH